MLCLCRRSWNKIRTEFETIFSIGTEFFRESLAIQKYGDKSTPIKLGLTFNHAFINSSSAHSFQRGSSSILPWFAFSSTLSIPFIIPWLNCCIPYNASNNLWYLKLYSSNINFARRILSISLISATFTILKRKSKVLRKRFSWRGVPFRNLFIMGTISRSFSTSGIFCPFKSCFKWASV